MKKTKIICSIGPSSNQPDVMEQNGFGWNECC